jgi:hypothetical protein
MDHGFRRQNLGLWLEVRRQCLRLVLGGVASLAWEARGLYVDCCRSCHMIQFFFWVCFCCYLKFIMLLF